MFELLLVYIIGALIYRAIDPRFPYDDEDQVKQPRIFSGLWPLVLMLVAVSFFKEYTDKIRNLNKKMKDVDAQLALAEYEEACTEIRRSQEEYYKWKAEQWEWDAIHSMRKEVNASAEDRLWDLWYRKFYSFEDRQELYTIIKRLLILIKPHEEKRIDRYPITNMSRFYNRYPELMDDFQLVFEALELALSEKYVFLDLTEFRVHLYLDRGSAQRFREWEITRLSEILNVNSHNEVVFSTEKIEEEVTEQILEEMHV